MKVAIIGCGKQAQKHIVTLKKLNINNIVVYDINSSMANRLADQYGLITYNDLEEIIKDASIDVIDICTPTPTHFTYATKALQSGKHVFCEKPLTTCVNEAEKLLELTFGEQRLGMVAFVFKYHPLFIRVKEALEAGLIGPLRSIFLRLGGKGSHRAWKHQTENGGGVVNEMMVHMLDLLLWYVGDMDYLEVVNLDNIVKSRSIDGSEVTSNAEDFALVIGRSKNGVKFVVYCDMISQSYTNHIEIVGDDGYINLSILESEESFLYLNNERPPYKKGKNVLEMGKVDLFELMFAEFFKNIREKGSLEKNTFAESLRLAIFINEIKKQGAVKRGDHQKD